MDHTHQLLDGHMMVIQSMVHLDIVILLIFNLVLELLIQVMNYHSNNVVDRPVGLGAGFFIDDYRYTGFRRLR